MHVYSSDSPEIRRYLLRDVLRENEKNPGLYAWTKDAIGEHKHARCAWRRTGETFLVCACETGSDYPRALALVLYGWTLR